MKTHFDYQNADEDHPIDDLIGRAIEMQAVSLDVTHLAKRIQTTCQSLPNPSETSKESLVRPTATRATGVSSIKTPHRIWSRSILAIAASMIVLIAFAIGRFQTSANAASVVRAARSVHSLSIERCYVVSIENASDSNEKNFLPFLKDVRIWTSGNRFWVESKRNDRRWIWGRNADGAVWMTLGDKLALKIEADEIGQPLQHLCDVYSLELESLLNSFQDRWSLSHQSSTDLTHTIIARPRRENIRITEAALEIDRETKAIRRLTLRKSTGNRAESSVVFTLVDFRSQDDSKYEPEGHLADSHQILSRVHFPNKRIDSLRTWFGAASERWIKVDNN